jgi:ferrochelatase
VSANQIDSANKIDALLVIAFGGPQEPNEIRPFLEHVLRGRPVPASRVEEVAHHYELIGGRSPLVELSDLQRVALASHLAASGVSLPIALGMWHSKPFLSDALRTLHAQGHRRVLGVVLAAFLDRITVSRYENAIAEALREIDLSDLQVTLLQAPLPYPVPEGFVVACADHVRAAFARMPNDLRGRAELVFTAHSVPTEVGHASGYVSLYESSAERIATRLGVATYHLAYQSRSGSPRDPWLEPDILEVVKARAAAGAKALVLAPIGFVCDHVEVLYDLDVEAQQVARELGMTVERAQTVTDHSAYIEALALDVLSRLR